MEQELNALASHLDEPDRTAAGISHWSVYQHLEHAALAAKNVADLLGKLSAGKGKPTGRPTLAAYYVLWTGRLPRGKAQAPDFVIPTDTPDPGHVRSVIDAAREALRAAGPPRGKNRMDHHVLGSFTAKQWLRFARVHTRHHLKIIRDIAKAGIVGSGVDVARGD